MDRQPEPELMDLPAEAHAYAQADFAAVNTALVDRLAELTVHCHKQACQVVDLGSGPGDIPIMVAQRFPTWHVMAVDGSAAMLDIALTRVKQAGLQRRVGLILADALETPLHEGCADILLCNSLLHHVRQPAMFWEEIKRLLKPTGMLLLRDLRRPESASAAVALVTEHAGNESDLLREEFYRSLLAAYTPDEVQSQLQAAGRSNWLVRIVSDRHLDVLSYE